MENELKNTNRSTHSKDSTHSALNKLYKLNKLNLLTTLFFYFSILLFVIAFNFRDTPPTGNWYQQFMPNIGSRQITDITFIDSLTGWSVTNATNQNNDTTFVLKTTNGGDNWVIQYRKIQTGGGFQGYLRVYFLNQNTGFASDVKGIDKSTDGGISWMSLNALLNDYPGMSVLNNDTIWLASSNPLTGGVFRTTNGGVSWQQQLNIGSSNPDHIYMYNSRIVFISKTSNTELRKTTDGGQTWNLLNGAGTGSFNDMYFTDSLTGWKCKTVGGGGWLMGKTTDGGFNWAQQTLPFGGNIVASGGIVKFTNINKDTIWAGGPYLFYPGQGDRAFLDRTTNGGDNWYMQIPDTSYQIPSLYFIKFIDKYKGWSYRVAPSGIHTTTGGDTTFYLPVSQISSEIPKDYKLFQNYPNPFNPKTIIKYQITAEGKRQNAEVYLKVFDIQGKEVMTLVNQKQNAGTYEVEFSGDNLSSGIYFYSFIINGNVADTKKMVLLK